MQAIAIFPIWHTKITCSVTEMGSFDPPAGSTCGEYLSTFMTYATGYIDNPDATSDCRYCGYKSGAEYLGTFNMKKHFDG